MNPNMTFFGQMLSFAILVIFTMKYIWPPLNAAIEARQKKIAEGLANAEGAEVLIQQAKAQADEIVREARTKANEVIEQAHQRGNQIVDQAKTDAMVEGTRLKALADAEIAAASDRAREDLRKQVSALAVTGAEKLLRREIDANAHKALLDELAAEI